jgi:hypothetical protein
MPGPDPSEADVCQSLSLQLQAAQAAQAYDSACLASQEDASSEEDASSFQPMDEAPEQHCVDSSLWARGV